MARETERAMTYWTDPRYYLKKGARYMGSDGEFNRALKDAFFFGSRQRAEDMKRRIGGRVIMKNPSKRKTLSRVRKALTKYVRGNAGRKSVRKSKKYLKTHHPELYRKFRPSLTRPTRGPKLNPPKVKGRKVKGGRAVTLRNFTGTIVKKSDGRVEILGRGRRK